MFVCLNICAHPQDPLLSLNSEVTQLSLTSKKCLAHPLEQGGMALAGASGCYSLILGTFPYFLSGMWVDRISWKPQATCNIPALGMALINDGQVKRE